MLLNPTFCPVYSESLIKRQKKIFDEALKKGRIKPKRFKLNVVGRDRSGKSCFVDALLGEEFNKNKISTEGIAIDVAMLSTEWRGKGKEENVMDKQIAVACVRRDREHPEASQQENEKADSTVTTAESDLQKVPEASQQENENADDPPIVSKLLGLEDLTERQRELIVKLQNDSKLFESLEKTIFAHIWDFGGQEPLLATHSALMPDSEQFALTAYAVVTNLTQLLSDDVIHTEYRTESGEDVKSDLVSLKTNLDFFKHWLTSIEIAHDREQPDVYLGKGFDVRYPPVFPIGTHIDEQAAQERLKDNNKILQETVLDKKYDDHIVKKDGRNQLEFFEVDNTKSGDDQAAGVHIIKDILDRMATKYWDEGEEQPLTWLQLERLLMEVVKKNDSSIITFDEAWQIGARLCDIGGMEDTKEALRFIASVGSVLYYPDAWKPLCDKVFTSPAQIIRAFSTFVSPGFRPISSVATHEQEKIKEVEKVEKSGFMNWKLAEALLEEGGTQQADYTAMLGLLYMFDIACSADGKQPVQEGGNLYVPCLARSYSKIETAEFPQWSLESGLPPPLILKPAKVDMIPEALFFRVMKRCIDKYWCSNLKLELKRNRCVLPLQVTDSPGQNLLQFEFLHLSRKYIAATVFWEGGTTDKDRSISAPSHCAELCKFLWASANECKKNGMGGLRMLLYCVATEKYDSVEDESNLSFITLDSPPDTIRDGKDRVVKDSFQEAIRKWYVKPSTQPAENFAEKSLQELGDEGDTVS